MAADVFRLVGSVLDNRYRVDSVVGEGGFGVVYRGFHIAFGQPIAIKCLKVDARFQGDARALFLRKFREEASFLARLSQHPAIVRVFDLNVTTSPTGVEVPYLVLEWLEGMELEQWLLRRVTGGPLGEREALSLLRPVIEAIALAHSLRIAHRDLKPANLFLAQVPGGTIVKVLDFGIAKSMGDQELQAPPSTQTTSGISAFSPQYGAPEQFRSRRFGATGPWTDVHALGLIIAELLSGKAPYPAAEMAEYFDLGTSPDRPTPRRLGAQVSDALEAVCARALALEPRDRFLDARALLEALDRIAAGATLPSTPSFTVANGPAGTTGPAMESAALPTDAYLARQAARSAQASSAPFASAPLTPPPHASSMANMANPIATARTEMAAFAQSAPQPPHTGGAVAIPAAGAKPKRRSLLPIAIAIVGVLGLAGGGVALKYAWPANKPKKKATATAAASTAPSATPVADTSREGLRLYRDRSDPANRATGIDLMKRACDAGYGDGCTGFAWATLYGEGVPKDEAAARTTLESQCSAGNTLACVILGDAVIDGVGGMAKNEKRGFDLLDGGCKAGQMLGCAILGQAYEHGKGVLQDPMHADQLFEQACNANEFRGCWQLALNYTEGTGVDKDEHRAAELEQKACNGGDMTGCFLLAMAYARGGGVPKDEKRGSELFNEACNGRMYMACSKLAACYARGEGVPKDPKHAAEILEKACDEGDGLGCHSLAVLYQKGEGVPQDMNRAVSLFDSACKDGRYDSCTWLGSQYALGQGGLAKDAKRAAELFDRACTGGDAPGCALLGMAYVAGDGVPADHQRGIDLLKKSCQAGDKTGCDSLQRYGGQ